MRARAPWLAALLAVAVLATGCSGFGAPAGYTIQAEFPRTFNLFPGSPVQILGIKSGIVETLEIEPGGEYVLATLRIDRGVELPEDVQAIVLTDALLGERYVQLDPPYDGTGPTLAPGTRLDTIGTVPAEFDDFLNALNEFVEGIQDGDLPRLVSNLADVLDGNGERIGETLEATRDALNVLRDNDEELVRLATKLADLNTTLNTRRSELTDVVRDFADLSQVLVDQRVPLDQSLRSLARLADETSRLLQTNRDLLERDVATLTRVGRTAERNLDHISTMLLSSAELFRHAERVLDRDHNWLPLVNNTDDLTLYLIDTLQARVEALCVREDVDSEECAELLEAIGGILPGDFCLPPLIACVGASGEELPQFGQAVADAFEQQMADSDTDPDDPDQLQKVVDQVVDGLLHGSRHDSDTTGDSGPGGAL
jgi:phospholipid/cholesterol/gamma-HCH transport system substrate-binding protein